MRKLFFLISIVALASFGLLAMTPVAAATDEPYPQTVTVNNAEIIEDNFFRIGNTVTIDGDVNGDVLVAGSTITVNGAVAGDVIALGDTVSINGPVAGNVRVGGTYVQINNAVSKNVNIAATTATISSNASVGWTLSFLTKDITVSGSVNGSIYGFTKTAYINAEVGNNTTVRLLEDGTISLGPKAAINGFFEYTSGQEASMDSAAVITGTTLHKLPPSEVTSYKQFLKSSWIFSKLINLFSLLLVGVILISIWKKFSQNTIGQMQQNIGSTMLWGLLYLLIIPIAVIIICLTIIGIPLGLIVLVAYLITIYCSPIFVGLMLGQKMISGFTKKNLPIIWSMMLGTTLYLLLAAIPWVGFIIGLVGTAWAIGSLGELIKNYLSNKNNAKPQQKNI